LYLVRFAYDVLPMNRDRAVALIRQEVAAAKDRGLTARLLVPLTRGRGEPALEYEVEISTLDELDEYRTTAMGSAKKTQDWMREFSEFLTQPPAVTVYRLDKGR
jgi:hypothetical protein